MASTDTTNRTTNMTPNTILHDGYHWTILAMGIHKEPKILTHLSREGGDVQIVDWIDADKLREAGVL